MSKTPSSASKDAKLKRTAKHNAELVESGLATMRRASPRNANKAAAAETATKTVVAAEAPTSAAIQIARIDTETLIVPIIGTMPLIVHNFSEKSKRAMLDAQTGVRRPKVKRDPQEEYTAAFYRTKDGYGFPVTAFKAATVGAARFYGKDVRMTDLRQFIFMRGEISDNDPQALVPIYGEPRMREDVVRLGGPSRSADLRYRPEFPEWSTTLEVIYVKSSLSRDSVLSLIDAGGLGIGVGEWRPEKRGEFGTYAIDQTKNVEVIS